MTGAPNASGGTLQVRVTGQIGTVAAAAWDACANGGASTFNPFISHAFLKTLEDAGCVGPGTGWRPCHLLLEEPDGALAGAAAVYIKSHSQGEYVFDHGWAEAYARAGGRYYPKVLSAVPFTPVPGPRLLVPDGPDRAKRQTLLASALMGLTREINASSAHINFLDKSSAELLAQHGFLLRTGQQFHWSNQNFASFEDYLGTFASRKRKAVRKEREQALSAGITIEHRTGTDITEADWDAMFAFYMDTGSRKWGRPYLNRKFFSLLGQTMARHCLLIFAVRDGHRIAGALNLIGGDCLYGRYWGAIEAHPGLHFEVCYHQAVDYAIAHGLARVEAGAQGEHKLARGYLPVTTYSVHWLSDPGFSRAVEHYLREEREAVASTSAEYAAAGPFRRDGTGDASAQEQD